MLSEVISTQNLQKHVQELGEHHGIHGLEVMVYRDEIHQTDIIKIVKRIDQIKVGTEISVTDREILQSKQSGFDILLDKLEQAVRKFDKGLGVSYPYHHREIFCRINDEHVIGRCEQCGYETALGNFPVVEHKKRSFIAVKEWRRILAAMYLCEKVHQGCHCGAWTDSPNFVSKRNL